MRNLCLAIRGLAAFIFLVTFTVCFIARWVIEGELIGATTWALLFLPVGAIFLLFGTDNIFGQLSLLGAVICLASSIAGSCLMVHFGFVPPIYNDPFEKKMRDIDEKDRREAQEAGVREHDLEVAKFKAEMVEWDRDPVGMHNKAMYKLTHPLE